MKLTKATLRKLIKEEMDELGFPDRVHRSSMSSGGKFRDQASEAIETLDEALEFLMSIRDGSSSIRNYDSEEMMRLGTMMHESAEIVEDMAQLFDSGHMASDDDDAASPMRESKRKRRSRRKS